MGVVLRSQLAMPKSKRNKVVTLAQTTKKGMGRKQELAEDIREALENYQRVFVFSTNNMRNTALKEVRQEWKHSRFFFGKNKVMSLALGRTAEEEIKKDIHKVSDHLSQQCGLLFTNQTAEEVTKYFKEYTTSDFARSGSTARLTIELPAGPLASHALSCDDISFPPSSLHMLHQLGLKEAFLNKGVIELRLPFTVCTIGDVLTPEQCRILKLWNIKLADFRFLLQCQYDLNSETYTNFLSEEK